MYLKVKNIQLKKLNEKDVLVRLKGKTAIAKKAQAQIESLLTTEFKKTVKTILGNKDVFYYTLEGVHIGTLSVNSGSLFFFTYSYNVEIIEEREITSSSYKRSLSTVSKDFNNYFRKN